MTKGNEVLLGTVWLATVVFAFFAGGTLAPSRGVLPPPPPTLGDPSLNLPLGSDLASLLNAHLVRGERPLSLARTLVIYVGDCSSCTTHSISLKKLRELGYPEVALAFRLEGPSIQKMRTEYAGMTILADPSGSLEKALNVRWQARWYVVKGGKLVYAQKDPKDETVL